MYELIIKGERERKSKLQVISKAKQIQTLAIHSDNLKYPSWHKFGSHSRKKKDVKVNSTNRCMDHPFYANMKQKKDTNNAQLGKENNSITKP